MSKVQNGKPRWALGPTCTLSPEPFELCSCLVTDFTWKPGCDFKTQQKVNVDCADGEVRAWSRSAGTEGDRCTQSGGQLAGTSSWSGNGFTSSCGHFPGGESVRSSPALVFEDTGSCWFRSKALFFQLNVGAPGRWALLPSYWACGVDCGQTLTLGDTPWTNDNGNEKMSWYSSDLGLVLPPRQS